MNIPILNIYYLLIYAWNVLDEADSLHIQAEDCTQLVDLFARVLHSGAENILRRGLDRGYLCRREAIAGIQGKLNLSASIKANTIRHSRAVCEFDELSHDVLHNRILKTTIRRLLNVPDLSNEMRDALVETYHRLHQIAEVILSEQIFRSVQLYRNNRYYRLLMDVCHLIHQAKLTTEEAGEVEFRDFFKDERRMRVLFEVFIRNFYKREQRLFHVGRTILKWQKTTGNEDSLKYLPRMQTDVTLTSDNRVIVIETKFVPEVLVKNRWKHTIRSSHLYQMFSYLKNISARIDTNQDLEGVLLYPTTNDNVNFEYSLHGHRLRVRTINLNQHWKHIEADLLNLL
jgi:5-methylcytosine-specific restriction enzyme subunit McrC